MTNWVFKNKEIKEVQDLPAGTVGFVYLIHNEKEDRFYIGKKLLLRKRTKKPLKGYKRKRVDYIESDWKTYTGSNIITKTWALEDCKRIILHACKDKRCLTYNETKEQFKCDVLEDTRFLNSNILGKFFR